MKKKAKSHSVAVRIKDPKTCAFYYRIATDAGEKDAVNSVRTSIVPYFNRNQFKIAVYDRISRVLTDYEEGISGAEDLYEQLCFLQRHWDDIIGENL